MHLGTFLLARIIVHKGDISGGSRCEIPDDYVLEY